MLFAEAGEHERAALTLGRLIEILERSPDDMRELVDLVWRNLQAMAADTGRQDLYAPLASRMNRLRTACAGRRPPAEA